jgi:hypothetical protein
MNKTYTIKNKVWAVLLGDVIPANLRGTTNNTFYTHYSCISTIQANCGLYHIGRGDVSGTYSNVFSLVASATGYTNPAVAEVALLSVISITLNRVQFPPSTVLPQQEQEEEEVYFLL